MANNRMYLRCKGCGQEMVLAKMYVSTGWFSSLSAQQKGQELIDFIEKHRDLLDRDEIYNHLCDGGGFWGVDGENRRVTLYDSSSDFGRPKHIEEAIRNDGERLLKLLGEVGDKEGNKFDLTGYDVTYMDAIGHRHVVKPWTTEEREELLMKEYREEIAKQETMWAGENPHKHRGGRQQPKDYAKKKKAKRRQQNQSRRKR